MDWHVALFAFLLAVACGIGFSVLPALQATNTDVAPALKQGAALPLSRHRRFGLRNLAMGAQVAGSLLLLLVTGFLVLGFMKSNNIQTNFNPKTMAFLFIDPLRDGYSPEKSQAFFERLSDRLRSAPAITSFALAAQPPYLLVDDDNFPLSVDDPHQSSPVQRSFARQTVGAGFFSVLNQPLLVGREFDQRDQLVDRNATGAPEPHVCLCVLNQKAAHALFGGNNAIGKHLRDNQHSYEVVGVVPDMKDATGATLGTAYLRLTPHDFAQTPSGGIVIVARGHSAEDAIGAVRSVVASMDPNLTLFNVQTLSEYLELSRTVMRSALRMFGGIGLFGLILSAIGLAGVTGYAVAQRRKEIGIRVALGARKSEVLSLVLREGATLVAVGTVIGFLGAVALAKALSALTTEFSDAFSLGVDDPRLLIGAPLLLAGLALLACYIPAHRAMAIDPLKALRTE